MSAPELVHRLASLIRANNASTFCLNGPPGSGKSHLLGELTRQLPREIPRTLALGPYPAGQAEAACLGDRLMQDCWEAGFLDHLPPAGHGLDLVAAWQWIERNAHVAAEQSFLVLVDLQGTIALTTIGDLFSSARYLEGTWACRDVRIFHMFAGYWDHPGLEGHFRAINTSFPYTVGHNYAIWDGLSLEEMIALARESQPWKASPMHGRLLHELTGGHPAAALDILGHTTPGDLTLPALLSATYEAAADGPASRALLCAWRQLPIESRGVLKNLVLQRWISAGIQSAHLHRLRVAGAIGLNQVGGTTSYLSFRSWYAELLARLHAEELGIADERTRRIRIAELTPRAFSLNTEAFRLISDIENQARNFLAAQLCLRQAQGEPLLKGRCRKCDYDGVLEDAHQRALSWKERAATKGMTVSLNPLLAYLSTRDLADLIKEVGVEIGSEIWQHTAQTLHDLSDVRDAVMHNQLIDDAALQHLYILQADIYAALSKVE